MEGLGWHLTVLQSGRVSCSSEGVAGSPAASPGSSCTCKEQVPPWNFPLQEQAARPFMSPEGPALAALDLK